MIMPKKDILAEEGDLTKGNIHEKIILDFVTDCRRALGENEIQKFCNLVELFAYSFPYDNKETRKEFEKQEKGFQLKKHMNSKTEGEKVDMTTLHLEYAVKKYGIIIKLLKAKNIYPKPGESDEW